MKYIIQQIAQELVEKIIKKAYSGKISDIDALTEDILADCKTSAARVVEAILAEMNRQIREDKQARKEQGLVMKQKDRPRSLLTKLGMLHIARDYYYDKVNESHVCILDKVAGILEDHGRRECPAGGSGYRGFLCQKCAVWHRWCDQQAKRTEQDLKTGSIRKKTGTERRKTRCKGTACFRR